MTTPAYGGPDGYGRYGILDTDDDGLLICHECGQPWKHLATHARAAHGLLAADYRARRGRQLTDEERDLLGDGLDLQAWADAARILLARDGVTARSLAEASDIAQPTVHQRIRRYPPRDEAAGPAQ